MRGSSGSARRSIPVGAEFQMTKAIEKDRRTPRYAAKAGTYVVYVEGTGAIRDLSMNGVFVLDSEPLPVGTTITFSLRTGAHDISLKGVVRRSVAEGMGIQFVEISPEARRRLRICIGELG